MKFGNTVGETPAAKRLWEGSWVGGLFITSVQNVLAQAGCRRRALARLKPQRNGFKRIQVASSLVVCAGGCLWRVQRNSGSLFSPMLTHLGMHTLQWPALQTELKSYTALPVKLSLHTFTQLGQQLENVFFWPIVGIDED